MAHHGEPMDIDGVDSDFDNKENTFHHNNVLPCTEKGYEELDVSELNMKLRYSITPASSPMSKSYTACLDNRNMDSDDSLNSTNENGNLTRSLNSTINKNDSVVKTLKAFPLQSLPNEQIVDNNRNSSVLRQLDTTIDADNNNVTVTISGTNDIDENLSLPSSSSSIVHTPEATTPTKDISKGDGGSPIMRGLKSVLNMFRSSQSPIPPVDVDNNNIKQEVLSPTNIPPTDRENSQSKPQAVASTPVAAHRNKDGNTSKRNSLYKESIVFNDDLKKELQWKDETTIIFSQEKIPIHKLFFQTVKPSENKHTKTPVNEMEKELPITLNTAVEYMDVSFNNSNITDKTMTEIQNYDVITRSEQNVATESDSEFLDCETTFTKNESQMLEIPTDGSATMMIDDKQKLNLNETASNINATDNISITNEKLTLKASCDTLEVNPSLNSDNMFANATDTKKDTLDSQDQDINIQSNILLPELVALIKPEEVPIINHVKYETHIVNQMSTAGNNSEKSLEIISQKGNLEPGEKNLGIKQNVADAIIESKIAESQIFNHNNSVDKDVPIEQADINMKEVQNLTPLLNHSNNLFMVPEVDILKDNVNKTVHVDDIEYSNILCDSNFKPQTLPACVSVEETVRKSLQGLGVNAEQIKLNDESKELPANIPLPLDEIEIENNIQLDVLAHNNSQGMCPDICDDINANINLDDTESLEKTQIEPTTENKLMNLIDNDSCVPEIILSSNIPTEKMDAAKFPDNNLNAGHEIIESCNMLEHTEVVALKDHSEETYREIQKVQSVSMNKNLNEVLLLPDLINQTIVSTSLQNIEQNACISNECAEQTQHDINNFENIKHNTNIPIIAEIVPINVDTKLPGVMPESNSSANVNDASLIFSNNDEIKQDNKYVNEINHNTKISATVHDEEKGVVFPEACQAKEPTKEIESKTEENQLQGVAYEGQIEKEEITIIDEDILGSGSKSAHGSMIDNIEAVAENIEVNENTFIKQTTVPSSPPITSKGYNFNFDEIDDPFATKTKIRMSPTLESPSKFIEPSTNNHIEKIDLPKKEINKNRRRLQPERKKPVISRKKFNSTSDSTSSVITPSEKLLTDPLQVVKDDMKAKQSAIDAKGIEMFSNDISASSNIDNLEKRSDFANVTEKVPTTLEDVDSQIQVDVITTSSESILEKQLEVNVEDKSSVESITATKEIKTTPSSDQSNYYSAGTSSNESILSRNVFNLPEIDDMNFNPFATKSKMRQSPSPTLETLDPFATRSKIKCSPDSSMVELPNIECENVNIDIDEKKQLMLSFDKNSEDKMETEPMEKDSSNTSNITCSSKTTDDKNVTVREVNTEDEDTIEGPFLEAEDHNIYKMSDIDSENIDMMQFTDIPVQENEENLDGGELFIDAEAFEFLLNQNKSNVVADSGKESLFLKFDPLFAKRISSDGLLAALNKLQKRQSTPTKGDKPPQKSDISPIPGPSTLNVTYEDNNRTQDSHEDFNVTVSKPTMVVTPAVNPVAAPRNKSLTPTRSNRRSITFTSPAMAVIDRLLSLSTNNSLVGHEATTTHVSREQNDADIALTQLRELLAEKEIHVYNLRSESKELKDRLATLESQMRILETDSQERLKKINELNDRLIEKTKINKSMAAVVEEYERTIASLIAETEQDKKRNAEKRMRLINERDEQTAHLASMEVSFSDLHSKYEKSKQVILSCKANEDTYKKSIQEFQENLTKMQSNYELLKQHATSKLNHANQELEKMNRAHEAEVLKLNAMIKRKDLHITSLEETLAQKTKANEELAAICDELINKVG